MRPIKFRGKRLDNHLPDTGKMVYGSLIAYEDWLARVEPKEETNDNRT